MISLKDSIDNKFFSARINCKLNLKNFYILKIYVQNLNAKLKFLNSTKSTKFFLQVNLLHISNPKLT